MELRYRHHTPAGAAGMGVDDGDSRTLDSSYAFAFMRSRTLGGIKDRRSFRWYSDTSMLICSMLQHTSAYVSVGGAFAGTPTQAC
jgi:hypothetical protein